MKKPIFLKFAVMFAVAGFIVACAGNSQQPVSEPVPTTATPQGEPASDSKVAEAPKDTSKQGRSAEMIMAVVKVNTPNRLKPMYNNFLRTKPGFGGKITVKFKILPDGNVETGEIVGTTMNFPEFEKAVLDDILQWKFDAGDYSNCTVTIPFTFSE
ncbi:TonB family protein [Fibrobacter succinogenes]|jgi:protein TonB|uniref:Protein TonB n=1 Tax=Fibrobacter succinogenes TaxID=833 RepID=A0A380S4D3_FIBSU|nr:TonB family protein [Fibrobacter succinogenes]PWJ35431.1 protein TonB [Fibrobacter succinogenes subsp. elongatus]SUQ24087.1 protein TonB [Fibrobacter succinogenes]